jgi:hypothetical protein
MVVATCAPKPLGVLLWSRTSKLNIKTEGIGTLHPKLISTVHGFCRSIINLLKRIIPQDNNIYIITTNIQKIKPTKTIVIINTHQRKFKHRKNPLNRHHPNKRETYLWAIGFHKDGKPSNSESQRKTFKHTNKIYHNQTKIFTLSLTHIHIAYK